MTLTIQLQRVGMSRVSAEAIPITARVFQGGKLGENLLDGQPRSDIASAKNLVQDRINNKFGIPVAITWVDLT